MPSGPRHADQPDERAGAAGHDRWIQFDDLPVRDRDMATVETLTALLADATAQFIYVNKMGAHLPVHDKAPEAFARYRPALPRGGYEEVSDTGSRCRHGWGTGLSQHGPGRLGARVLQPRHSRTCAVAASLASALLAGTAFAQPQISLSSTVVAPGESVTVTVTGVPGAFFAVLGSSVNGGFSYAGVALSVGSDVVILAQGVIGGRGEESIPVAPPLTAPSSTATTCRWSHRPRRPSCRRSRRRFAPCATVIWLPVCRVRRVPRAPLDLPDRSGRKALSGLKDQQDPWVQLGRWARQDRWGLRDLLGPRTFASEHGPP